MKRRVLLLAVLLLAACGGGDDGSPQRQTALIPVPPASQPEWVVRIPSFAAGSGTTFDLATTLPDRVARNGVFSVSGSGAKLPAGMTLSARGILSVGSATVGEVTGVVFSYEAP